MGELIFITGGARSGKSAFAERMAEASGRNLLYIATARVEDDEMKSRIAQHQARRSNLWRTIEEPISPAAAIKAHAQDMDAILLDCITVLLSNLVLAGRLDWESSPPPAALAELERAIMREIDALIEAGRNTSSRLLVVSNELGCGMAPLSALARFFRDCAGRANQRLAAAADAAYLVVAGISLRIKGN